MRRAYGDHITEQRTPTAQMRREAPLGEQPLTRLRVLDKYRADRTVLRRLEDLCLGVRRRIHHLGLPVVIQPESLRRDRLAHRVADTGLVVNPDLQLACHGTS